jgi:hypothetical protein
MPAAFAAICPLPAGAETWPMTAWQILMLASEALAYDAVVVLWVGRSGTQPVLMPRALGQLRAGERASQPRALPSAASRARTGT